MASFLWMNIFVTRGFQWNTTNLHHQRWTKPVFKRSQRRAPTKPWNLVWWSVYICLVCGCAKHLARLTHRLHRIKTPPVFKRSWRRALTKPWNLVQWGIYICLVCSCAKYLARLTQQTHRIKTPIYSSVSAVPWRWNLKEASGTHTMSGTVSDIAYTWSLKKAVETTAVMGLQTMRDNIWVWANILKIFNKRPTWCIEKSPRVFLVLHCSS